MKITRAVIPVAGIGTRFLPASKAAPKELFPVLNKPVIQYLTEELREAGIREIVFVLNREKMVIKNHFSRNRKLETLLESRGKTELVNTLKDISRGLHFSYVLQNAPLGDGHAILCAKKLIGNEPCVVIFGDTLVDGNLSMTRQMLKAFEKYKRTIVSVMPVPKKLTASYGIAAPLKKGNVFEISELVEKPAPSEAPSNLAVIGSYIITPAVLRELSKRPTSVGGEIRLIDGLKLLKKKEPVYGCTIKGTWLDTGTVEGWLRANLHMARKFGLSL